MRKHLCLSIVALLASVAALFAAVAPLLVDFTLDSAGEFRVNVGDDALPELAITDDVFQVYGDVGVVPAGASLNQFQVTDGSICANPDATGAMEFCAFTAYGQLYGARWYAPSASIPAECNGGDPYFFYVDTTGPDICFCDGTAAAALDGSGTCA